MTVPPFQVPGQTSSSATAPSSGFGIDVDSTSGSIFTVDSTGKTHVPLSSSPVSGQHADPFFDLSAYGTLDKTGATMTGNNAAFTAMIAAYNASPRGGVMFIPAGVYLVNTGIITALSTTAPGSIQGADRGVTVLIPGSATGDMILCPNGDDGFSIKNLALYQTGTPQTAGSLINTNGCNDLLIEDVLFVNGFYDVNVNGSSIKVNITHCYHSQTNGSANSVGILVNNGAAGDTYIGPDIVMSNTGATRRRASVEIIQSGHFEVNQCNLTGSAQGMIVDPGAGQIVADGFINYSLFDSCTVNGVTLNAATATSTIYGLHFVNSWFSGTISGTGGAGLVTTGVAGGILNDVEFIGCRALNNQTHGYQHGFGTDFRWNGGKVAGNSQAGAAANDGINIAAGVSNFMIVNVKSGGTLSATTGGNQRYGINVVAGASNNYIINGNDLIGNSTAPYFDGGTGGSKVVKDNLPLLPIGAPVARTASLALAATPGTIALQLPLPAGSVQVGTTFRIKAFGQNSATAAGTIQAIVRAGTAGTTADTAVLTGVAIGAATTAVTFEFEALVTITAVGASPTAICSLRSADAAAFGLATTTAPVALASYNTATQAGFLSLNLVLGGTGAAGTIYTGTIEVLKP